MSEESQSAIDHGIRRRRRRRLLMAALGFACLLPLAYRVENWRGNRAWAACMLQAERQGHTLAWEKFAPPAVPDELNAFKAPIMSQWFTDHPHRELWDRMNLAGVFGSPEQGEETLAEITIVPFEAGLSGSEFDLMLEYSPPFFSQVAWQCHYELAGRDPVVLIIMDSVPLSDAIRNLARQAGLDYVFADEVTSHWFGTEDKPLGQPVVSMRWETVTAKQALITLLHRYKLDLVHHSRSSVPYIEWKRAYSPDVYVETEARQQLARLLKESSTLRRRGLAVQSLRAATGAFVLFSDKAGIGPFSNSIPARICVQAARAPTAQQLQQLFHIAAENFSEAYRLRVVQSGENSFRVVANPAPLCAATDYLTRTEGFERDFDSMRQALKRPMARVDGDYSSVTNRPMPNYASLRISAQALAQRAQAHLLLDRPDEALQEIRLAWDLCGLLENKPSGTPVPLVTAMIRVAVVGLCATTIEEGFQLGRWRGPQLPELQQMLSETRLAPAVAGALSFEQAAICRIFETFPAEEFVKMFTFQTTPASPQGGFKSPTFWFLKLAPHGWVKQNMVTVVTLHKPLLKAYDSKTALLCPEFTQHAGSAGETSGRFDPYTWLARTAVPHFVRAWQATARNQALVHHSFVACGLERYREVHGIYPEQLDALVPGFAARIPQDILTGESPRYRLKPTGEFLLYSVGWDRTDDGGNDCDSVSSPGITPGDWVWAARSVRD